MEHTACRRFQVMALFAQGVERALVNLASSSSRLTVSLKSYTFVAAAAGGAPFRQRPLQARLAWFLFSDMPRENATLTLNARGDAAGSTEITQNSTTIGQRDYQRL